MWLNATATVLSFVTFLVGLKMMRSGLSAMGNGRLPDILQTLAKTPTRGIATGIVSTALLQSSAAVTAISVGLVASGSMVFRDALGIVLGANVGSTVTPQLLTLNLWALVVPCMFLGLAAYFSGPARWRSPGVALIGFCTLFVSLQAMTIALHPLAKSAWFAFLLGTAAQNIWIAALMGVLASAMVQSSTAVTVITMALVSDASVPLATGIAIVLGANVGTCLTSIIAAIGQSRPAQQVAVAHVLLNLGGVIVALPLLHPFTSLVSWMTPVASQQIADAHTLFNLFSTLAVWPFTRPFATGVERLLPDHRHA
ncbi:Na/Pi cotransporter family protein [Alicyclobacillaceae bacterium I2511]|jgi:phosphate:Na+ symporter|nr:Na/Pi cotransporter family protein [Alicyclobacillaceae bacterium I2511]